jgi:hypothetical protein
MIRIIIGHGMELIMDIFRLHRYNVQIDKCYIKMPYLVYFIASVM